MYSILVKPVNNGRFDVDLLVRDLDREIGTICILADDSFLAERARSEQLIAELEKAGTPLQDPERILRDIDNKAFRLGPGKDVQLAIESAVLHGQCSSACSSTLPAQICPCSTALSIASCTSLPGLILSP